MNNSDDGTLQTITIVSSHHIIEGQYVAIKHVHVCTWTKPAILVLFSSKPHCNTIIQLRNKGGEGDGVVG